MFYEYQVFYIIKRNRGEYLYHMYVSAENARQAAKMVWADVKEQTGRHAFCLTPIRDDCPEHIADARLAPLYARDPSARPDGALGTD